MNIEEAKKMEGFEFTYIFEDGDTVQAYVKKFDPEVGLTCLSLETETASGWKPNKNLEEDGTFCVIGCPANKFERCLSILAGIKETGVHHKTPNKNPLSSFNGCVFRINFRRSKS